MKVSYLGLYWMTVAASANQAGFVPYLYLNIENIVFLSFKRM